MGKKKKKSQQQLPPLLHELYIYSILVDEIKKMLDNKMPLDEFIDFVAFKHIFIYQYVPLNIIKTVLQCNAFIPITKIKDYKNNNTWYI